MTEIQQQKEEIKEQTNEIKEEVKEDYKMVFCVRNDLKMGRGKIAAQCGHAAVECTLKSSEKQPEKFHYWHEHDQTKVALRVDSLDQMFVFIIFFNFH